jgi:hypothetical protein
MIQPAALPFAGNLLVALGLPGDGAAEPGISADFSCMLAAKIDGEHASAVPALAIQPALAAAFASPGGKPAGKGDGKILPDALAGTVRSLPLVQDSAAVELSVKVEPASEELGDNLPAEASTAAIPSLATPLAAAGQPQPAATTLLPATKAKGSARLTTRAPAPLLSHGNPSSPAPVESPSLSYDKLAMPRGKGTGGGPAHASIHVPTALHSHVQPLLVLRQFQDESRGGVHNATSQEPGAVSASPPLQAFSANAAQQPLVALPIAALHAARFTLIPAAPLAADLAVLPQVNAVPVEALTAQPPSPAGPQLQGLSLTSPALVSRPRISADAARQGEDARTESSPPPPIAAGSEPAAETLPLPLASAIASASAQSFTSPANPPPAPVTAPVQPPHDFSALIDLLVEARDMAQAIAAPGVVHAAVAHGDFGQVSLQFQQDGDGLTVALTSNDPDFARAVQAAAPAGQTAAGSDQGAAPRQESSGQQSSGTQFAQSNAQQRGHSQSREGGNPRPSNNPSQSQRGADEPVGRGGIFA